MDYEKQKRLSHASLPSVPVTAANPMWNPHHEYYQWMYQPLNTMYAPPFRTHPMYGYMNDCQMNGHAAEDCPMNEMFKKIESYSDPLVNVLLKDDSYPRHLYYSHPRYHPYYQHRIFSHPM